MIGQNSQRIRIGLKTRIRIESDEFDEDDSDEIIMTQVGFQVDDLSLHSDWSTNQNLILENPY